MGWSDKEAHRSLEAARRIGAAHNCLTRIEELQKAGGLLGTLEYEDIRIEVLKEFFFDDSIELLARVWKNGKQLGFGPDGRVDVERFKIHRPPLYIIDQAGNIPLSKIAGPRGIERQNLARLAPREALTEVIARSALVGGRPDTDVIENLVGRTTSTLFATLSFFLASSNATYATMQTGSSLSANTASGNLFFGQDNGAGSYDNYETFLRFNTSGVAGIVSSCQLTTTVIFDADSVTAPTFTGNARLIASLDTTTKTNNWKSGTNAAAQTLLATQSIPAGLATDAVQNWTSDANFVNSIQASNTDIGLYSSRFEASNVPGTNIAEQGAIYDETASGTTKDPTLVIVAGAAINGQMNAGGEV